MKRILKKSIAMILVVVMSVALLSVTALAADDDQNNNVYVIRSDVEASGITMQGTVYIADGVTLTTTGEITLDGEVYVYGTWENEAHISGAGTIHCAHYNSASLPANARGVFKSTHDTSVPYGPISVSTNSTYLNDPVPEGRTWDPTDENSPSGSEAFAVYCVDDTSLTFYTDDFVPTAGDTYNGKAATEVYEDVDTFVPTAPWEVLWCDVESNTTDVVFDSSFAAAQPVTCWFWFNDFEKLNTVKGLGNLDTSSVTNMDSMFNGCSNLTELDVSGFDTSNVTEMNGMFTECSGLTSLDVSGFDTSNVTNMSGMFWECSGLTELDVSGFDTSSVTDMALMFGECVGLSTLDLSGFDTSSLTTTREMFEQCTGLTELDVSGFDTASVTDMERTFSECTSLTDLDLSGWDTTSVTSYRAFATDCTSLQHVVLGGKTDIFTKGRLVDQQDWYNSNVNGTLVSSSYLQDAPYPGEYWTYTESRTIINGLHKDSDGVWRYYVDGTATNYTGFAENDNGKWYVENGVVTFKTNGVIKDTTGALGENGAWYYVVDSKVQTGYTGVANHSNASGWWYVVKGKVDFSHTGVERNDNGWWYVTGGKVDFSHNGVDKNSNGWWYIVGGKVNFNYTGVANYKNSNGWWYIKNGKVDFSFNGRASNKNGTWNVVNGKVRF